MKAYIISGLYIGYFGAKASFVPNSISLFEVVLVIISVFVFTIKLAETKPW